MTACTAEETATVHANALALGVHGLLIRGEPGSGKSTLTRTLLSNCTSTRFARLVADDRVILHTVKGQLIASGKPGFAGLIEIHGLGLTRVPHLDTILVTHVVDLIPEPQRLPEPDCRTVSILKCDLARIVAPANDPRASIIVRAALEGMVQDDG